MRWACESESQTERRVRARIHVADEELLLGEVRFHVGLEALELFGRDRLVHLAPPDLLVESGSCTRNLSLGLRPVWARSRRERSPDVTTPSYGGVRARTAETASDSGNTLLSRMPMRYLVEPAWRRCSKASTAAITAIFTMSGTSDNLCKTWTVGHPTRIGPIARHRERASSL